jgi:hypothetical protein
MTRLDPLDAALLAAWNASEPELPECHLCGDSRGPWVPEPSGDRWPSGAQKLVCQRGCDDAAKGVHTMDTLPPAEDAGASAAVDTPGDERGTETIRTPGGPLDAFDVEQARQLLADIEAIDYRDDGAAYRLLGRARVIVPRLLAVIERAEGDQ